MLELGLRDPGNLTEVDGFPQVLFFKISLYAKRYLKSEKEFVSLPKLDIV